MGRYSSVQAYADNNANMRAIPHDQATGGAARSSGALQTEKVSNPYGSTAGAGSGEFHVYRHARSREMGRWKRMEEEEAKQRLDDEFRRKRERDQQEEERKTAQRRKKRQRQKEAKQRKKNLKLAGVTMDQFDERPATAKSSSDTGEQEEEEEEEFTYNPIHDGDDEGDTKVKPTNVSDSSLPSISAQVGSKQTGEIESDIAGDTSK